ncbi:MAG: collagen binding domain-containing protein, partial [Oscillospiraceae bacterium]
DETQIETPETGATFEVYLKSAGSYEDAKETERDVLTCDENGFAQTKDMPYGIYTVKQTSGWDGRELMKPFDVFISADGQTYRYLINNANFESYIKIVKKDAETGKTIPYAGAGFQIYDPNGELVTMTFTYPEVTTIDTFYTTADGDLITPQTLEYGTGYSIVEVQAPYGYVLNSEPVYFDVVQDNSAEESGITVIEVVRSNLAQKGTITVSKSGEVFSTVAGDKGLYQPIFSVSGLEGAVYEIIAAEDIYTLDGTLRAEKGEVVDTLTTGTDGAAKSKELYLGKYEVKEIEAPYGMVLNKETHAVELVYAGQNVAVTETATSFYNERQRVEIDLVKSLETDETYGVGNNSEILDVTFGLYAEKDLTAADGTVIPADGLIEVITLDGNGHGKAISDLPMGSYYVQEISTNSAYLKDDAKYPVVFEYAGQETATVHISVNDGEAIENKIIYGSVSGKKSDEDGKALGGALIGIFQTGTTEFTEENAIATATSAEDGSFSFAKVPYGTWVIREIESPKGFVLSEEEIAVTIGKVDEVVEIELVNYFIKGNIELTKVDKDYPDNKLSGAVFEVYADTNGNGEFDKDDELLGEMTELDGGIYQMKELRYGNYFVREKTAPTGFVLDEKVYSVSIEENGKTYVVENEAGKGFMNAAQTGSLKIVKTSSDGKLEGFSFRVTGTDYDKTFKTDKNGEIFIEDLRIGEYTVSEVSDKASAGYILPADKQATVKVGATTTVQMHNELRDTPKTGDDFNPYLWGGLAAVSLIGAGALGFIGFKNRKKKED